MNQRHPLSELLIAFCVCTACITILEGTLGALFYPEETLTYNAFFAPPIFGALSVLLGLINLTRKELTVRQVLIRKGIHLLLIEGMVFGLNFASGIVFPPIVTLAMVLGIALVFVLVYVILWVNDQRSAQAFNQKLKEYQAKQE